MFQRLKNILIGEPLTHDDSGDGHLLSKIQALAMLSSDALSSIAYGPEQVVLVLTAVSSAAIWWSIPIGLLVLVLLASLTISYRQVIKAYPQGGGAYMVTTENLSPKFGLIAGGSLFGRLHVDGCCFSGLRCRCHYFSPSFPASFQS